jgi:hypothetical protein
VADERPAEQPSKGGTNKLILKLPPRVPVNTSQGLLFARHLALADFTTFDEHLTQEKHSTDLKGLGTRLLKTLVCAERATGQTESPALTEEVYDKLSCDDIKALAEGVAKACDAGPLPEGQPLEALGSVMFDMMVEHTRRMAESAKQIAASVTEVQRTLAKGFGGVSATVQAALAENLSGMSVIRERLKTSAAVEAIRKAQENEQNVVDRFAEDLRRPSELSEALRKATQGTLTKDVRAMLAEGAISQGAGRADTFLPRVSMPPFEETPLGRAAIAGEASVRQLQEVAGLVGQMTEQLGRLHTLFLTEVIPQWVENLEEGSRSTNTSIGLARKAIYWSIGVTVLMTSWQVWLARDYKIENDKQQEASEALVRQQLTAAQELNKHLAADSLRLRDELAKLNHAVVGLQPPTATVGARSNAKRPKATPP